MSRGAARLGFSLRLTAELAHCDRVFVFHGANILGAQTLVYIYFSIHPLKSFPFPRESCFSFLPVIESRSQSL